MQEKLGEERKQKENRQDGIAADMDSGARAAGTKKIWELAGSERL